MLRVEAFDEALADFCADEQPERLALLATYGSRGLRRMLTGVYETLRAAGRPLELSLGDAPALDARRGFASRAVPAASPTSAAPPRRAARPRPGPESLLDLAGYAVKGDERLRAGARARSSRRR